MNRDASLEAAICNARDEDAPWLVYADWLSERGDERLSESFSVLGGRPIDTPRARETLALAVATGLWTELADVQRKAPWISALTRFARGEPLSWPSSATHAHSLQQAIDALERGAFSEAARFARTQGPAAPWLRLLQCVLGTPTPFTPATDLVHELLPRETSSEAFSLDASTRFSFEHVRVRGIEGRLIMPAPAAADGLLAMVMHIHQPTPPADPETALVVDSLEDATGWHALSPFECLHQLFSWLADNEGHRVAIAEGVERPLLDQLELLGPCLGGASSATLFPFKVMRFEGGLAVFHYPF